MEKFEDFVGSCPKGLVCALRKGKGKEDDARSFTPPLKILSYTSQLGQVCDDVVRPGQFWTWLTWTWAIMAWDEGVLGKYYLEWKWLGELWP